MRHYLVNFVLLSFLLAIWPASYADTTICRFGIPPWQKGRSFNEERKKYLPLLKWMSTQTDCKFVPIGATSYEDLIKKIAQGKVQVAELGAVSYVQAKKQNPEIQLLATALSWNADKTKLIDAYHSVVVTLKKHSLINTLQDLKGKSFGFVNHESSSGFAYPSTLIKAEGINYETFFSKYFFLGSHPNVTDAIVAGSIVAGATASSNYEAAQKKHGDIFKVLWKSPPIPNVLFASHPSLPPKIRKQLLDVLPQVDGTLLEDMTLIKGFVIRPDSFYDVTQTVLEQGGKVH